MKTLEQWCIENNETEELALYNNAKNEKKSSEISFSSTKKVNWKCSKCGIEWKQSLNKMSSRAQKDCLYCTHKKASYFYNLSTEYPMLEKQWYYEKNEKEPKDYLPNSSAKVWWKCEQGHIWKACIVDRRYAVDRNTIKGNAICPYCNHSRASSTYNLVTEYPNIARQWNYLKNGKLKPTDVSPKSQKNVWWVCDFNPNHIWKDRISNRTALNRECTICSKEFTISFPARSIYYYLKQYFDDCEMEYRVLKKYVLDICIPSCKIAIEYDGWYFHSSEAAKIRENKKDDLLKKNQFEMLRIKERKEESNQIIVENNRIEYYLGDNYKNLDTLIREVLLLIGKKTKRNFLIDVDTKRDNQKIENLYYHVRKSNTLAVKCPELVEQWSSKNDRSPDTIRMACNYKAKWICEKCQKEYESTIHNRVVNKSGCPYCANRKVSEQNSLKNNYPDKAKQWNYDKNDGLGPEDVTSGSDKEVWWKCEKGHEWKAKVYTRTGKNKGNCPYCSHTKLAVENSLEIRKPELKQIWDYEKNKGKTPKDFFYSSNKNVYWKCEKGHEWEMSVNKIQRIKSEIKCPYCRGTRLCKDNSLAVMNRELSEEWNYEKNGKSRPEDFLPSSGEKVWWKCKKGHEWKAKINVRNRGSNCPFCAGLKFCKENSFAENEKELLKEWCHEKNGALKPDQVSKGSGKKIWWQCEKGHTWEDTISHRKEGRKCPYCYGRKKPKTS